MENYFLNLDGSVDRRTIVVYPFALHGQNEGTNKLRRMLESTNGSHANRDDTLVTNQFCIIWHMRKNRQ